MSANWVTCPNCGAQRNTSGDYTSPANREKDQLEWESEHVSQACIYATADEFDSMSYPPVREGVCLICGGAVLNRMEHIDPDRHAEQLERRRLARAEVNCPHVSWSVAGEDESGLRSLACTNCGKQKFVELKRRPFILILEMLNAEGVPWRREATDADLQQMAHDPIEYEPRDGTKDRWSW